MARQLNETELAAMAGVFRDLFNDPELEITDAMTAADVPGWDSFNHINLVIMIEEQFKIRFTTTEIDGLANVGQFKALIASKLR